MSGELLLRVVPPALTAAAALLAFAVYRRRRWQRAWVWLAIPVIAACGSLIQGLWYFRVIGQPWFHRVWWALGAVSLLALVGLVISVARQARRDSRAFRLS